MSWEIFPEGSLSPCSSGERGTSDACVDLDKVTGAGCMSPSLCSTRGSICAIGRGRGRLRGDVVRTLASVHVGVPVPAGGTALEAVELLFECTPTARSIGSELGRKRCGG
jgi:hypothetical protein